MGLLELSVGLLQENAFSLWFVGLFLALLSAWLITSHLRKVKQDVQRRVIADPGTFSSTTLKSSVRITNRFYRTIEAIAAAGGVEDLRDSEVKALRAKLLQVGYFNKSAVRIFFGLRIVAGAMLAFLMALVIVFFLGIDPWTNAAMSVIFMFGIGYMAPYVVLNWMIDRSAAEHRSGFPDFMDLMVVCVEAGLSMEAGLQRIGAELRTSYPSLAMHLDVATIEIRSGKTMSAAIESFAKRLGIEEATSFSTLLTQSEELGSSLSQSLRVYSDDMRNKRLMKAEEKAHSLPAKLVVPLTLFVFPTLLVVLLLPVVVSISGAL